MAYIGNDLQVAFSTYKNIDDISGSFNSVTTSFALLVNGSAPAPLPLNSNQCLISVGGVVQRPDDTGSEGFRLSGGNIIFSSAPNTGEDFFGVILAGADYVNAGANFPDGTLAAPSITFDQDNDTGYYRSGSGSVSFASNGVAAGTWSSAGLTAPALIPTGSSVPANGVYLPGVNRVGVSTNSSARLEVDASGRLLVGTSSSSTAARLVVQAHSGSATDTGIAVFAYGGTSPADGVGLGSLRFSDSNHGPSALVQAERDGGTWTSGSSQPTRLVFSTTADGASSPTERLRISSDGSMSAVIPGGSTLYPAFTCRAWVNFNGTATVAIRASGNVSSITDRNTGRYTVNLSTAMPDTNFAAILGLPSYAGDDDTAGASNVTSTSAIEVSVSDQGPIDNNYVDCSQVHFAIFR